MSGAIMIARRPLATVLLLLAIGVPLLARAAPFSPAPIAADWSLTHVEITRGLSSPIDITHAADGSGRLFITLQGGQIYILEGTRLRDTPFLDISRLVSSRGERGLLGLAFHPDYQDNGLFFIHYTDRAGTSVLARYQVAADNPDQADPSSATTILTVPQPYANHNGGQLQFGSDGYLYVALGDGGGDPENRAQDLGTLLGKLLRLDVDASSDQEYAIPSDNPFIATKDARPEIWAYGLRNPWRFSFDRQTGDLFIGDVGQGRREEINYAAVESSGGENYGWPPMEGSLCYRPTNGCDDGTLVLPILEYDTPRNPCGAVTGGYRYRGIFSPVLRGIYLYADFCTGQIWGAVPDETGWTTRELLDTDYRISTFGEDEAGEIYIADHGSGRIARLVASPRQTHLPLIRR
jgi:glucose/arabinose dehydrogenase